MSDRKTAELLRELTGLMMRELWALPATSKGLAYNRAQARQLDHEADVLVTGLAALNVRAGERRLSMDLDQAAADAAADGVPIAAVCYQRPGRDHEEAYVVTSLRTFAELLGRAGELTHA